MTNDTHEMLARVERLGITSEDALALRRISMTLHNWHELECGTDRGAVERDEVTGKCYWLNSNTGKRYPYADRETGALKRLAVIMARYPELVEYVQTDPRGASLYILRREQLADGAAIDSVYSGRGVAIYK